MAELTLYSIPHHLVALLDSIDMCETDEQRAECEAEICRTIEALIKKVDGFTQFMGHLDSQIAFSANEIQRLKVRQAGFEKTSERLEEYAIRVMESLGVRKLEGKTSRMWLRENQPAVEIDDQELLPGQYKIVKQDISVDKRAIKRDIDAGAEIPGAHLRPPSTSLIRR